MKNTQDVVAFVSQHAAAATSSAEPVCLVVPARRDSSRKPQTAHVSGNLDVPARVSTCIVCILHMCHVTDYQVNVCVVSSGVL